MRKPHMLKGNKKTEQWNDFVFFDTETVSHHVSDVEERLHFVLGWACYVRRDANTEEWRECFRRRDLYDFILSKCLSKRRLVVIAHNLYFDLRVSGFLQRLLNEEWLMKRLYVAESGVQSFFLLRKGDRSLLLLDSMNWFNTSIKKLGELYGQEKHQVDFQATDMDYLSAYCSRDVEILRTAVLSWLSFLKNNNLGNTQKTLASQAFGSFRHRFMEHPIHIHAHAEAARLERGAYFGGRVENFQVGRVPKRLHKLDINSMYPAMMHRHPFPWSLHRYYDSPVDPDKLLHASQTLYPVALVRLDTPIPRYPMRLPHRVVYPIGAFSTVLMGDTLRAALTDGHVRSVQRVALYSSALLFRPFVDFFWGERRKAQREHNVVHDYLFKLILNSFYGKFAQLGYEQDERVHRSVQPLSVEKAMVNGRLATIWTLGLVSFVNYRMHATPSPADLLTPLTDEDAVAVMRAESFNSFPVISAAVTDYARDCLWQLMEQAGREHVYYVDTDCLFVDDVGRERLAACCGPELGQLKVEGETDHCILYAPKDYVWGDEKKTKGITKSAVPLEQERTYLTSQWERWRTGLRLGWNGEYRIVKRVKTLKRVIEHGTVTPGGRIIPLVMRD